MLADKKVQPKKDKSKKEVMPIVIFIIIILFFLHSYYYDLATADGKKTEVVYSLFRRYFSIKYIFATET